VYVVYGTQNFSQSLKTDDTNGKGKRFYMKKRLKFLYARLRFLENTTLNIRQIRVHFQ